MSARPGDFFRGLIMAVPVLAAAALGVREVLHLREENRVLEARLLQAERQLEAERGRIAAIQAATDRLVQEKLRVSAMAADAQGAAEDRLQKIIAFLKSEASASEQALNDARNGRLPIKAPPTTDRVPELLKEIGRLNAEIERLKGR